MIAVSFLPEEREQLIELLENDLVTAKRENNERMIDLYTRLLYRLREGVTEEWDLR